MLDWLKAALNTQAGGAAALGAGAQIAGQLFGQKTTNTTSTGFDQSQLPFFLRMLGQTQQANQQARQQISGVTGQQLQASQAGYGQLLGMLSGLGNEQLRRITERETAARGRGRMALGQRGLRNTTLGISSDVAAARQAARERLAAQEQIQGRLAGAFGQQLQASDRIRAGESQALISLLGQNPQLLGLLAQNIAGSQRQVQTQKKHGLFG